MPRRKTVTMLVTVSVPAWLTPADIRREVRALVGDACLYGTRHPATGWPVDGDDIVCRSVKPAPATR